jgi:hypothetical protein
LKNAIYVIALGYFLFNIVIIQADIVLFPYQLEYREGAMLYFTQGIIDNINQFSLENAPFYTNNYGLLYNWVSLPFVKIFGNTLQTHRAVTAVFTFFNVSLIVAALRKKNSSIFIALAGGVLFWISQLYYVMPMARPDSLGMFLFLVSMFLPWYKGYSSRSVIISGIIGSAAFFVKPYFILCVPLMGLYIFLFISKKKGFYYALTSLLVISVVVSILRMSSEMYLYYTVYSNIGNTSDNVQHAINQLSKFARENLGLILFGGFLFAVKSYQDYKENKRAGLSPPLFNKQGLIDFSKPFIAKRLNLEFFCLLITIPLIYFLLGRHVGTRMVYLYQFMTPFLILLVVGEVKKKTSFELIFIPIFVLTFSIFMNENIPNHIREIDFSDWEKAENYISSSENVLNTPAIVSVIFQQEKPIVDTGQIEYYYHTLPQNNSMFFPNNEDIIIRGQEYTSMITKAVNYHDYDYVLINEEDSPPFIKFREVRKNYRQIDSLDLWMPQTNQKWTVSVWEPDK